MSGTFPIASSKFESFNFKSIQNTIISKSNSGKKLARQIDGQRWGFTVSIITSTRDSAYGELMAFIVKQRSQFENFIIVPNEISSARGTETNILYVNGNQTAGDTTIAIDNFASDSAGRLKAGDVIKFASHDKVYMVVADVTPSSGEATVTIEPPLVENIADNSIVSYDNVPFTVYLTNDIQEFGVVGTNKNGELLYKFELDLEEAL